MRQHQHQYRAQDRRSEHRRCRRAVRPNDYRVGAIPIVSEPRTRLTIVNIVMAQSYAIRSMKIEFSDIFTYHAPAANGVEPQSCNDDVPDLKRHLRH